MPRSIGNYVIEDKIGSGQFGEVYKGYNKDTGKEIAIKAISRSLFTEQKKFKELFENEMKVLKACQNVNIIKMYDVKRTTNNYYLILEYCNEGDLKQYLEKKGKLSEEEAVDILIQILNAFKTLVKKNILHRDLKLANVLKHNGIIKVADFGFCKVLEGDETKAKTYLGTALNMAPEILSGKPYDNKADIWSIGTVFYELLFGVSVFGTSDIKALKKPEELVIEIPREGCTISEVAKDVLKRMLVVDPEKRITWEELFLHRINTYRDEKIMKDLNTSLDGSRSQSLKESMSKFYINTNKVVQHLQDYKKKEQINKFAKDAAMGGDPKSLVYKGPVIQHSGSQVDQDNDSEDAKTDDDGKATMYEDGEDDIKGDTVTAALEKKRKMIQRNSNRTLHERNKCAFLGGVADETSMFELELSNHATFVLVKQLNYKINLIKRMLQKGDKVLLALFSIEKWDEWIQTKEYENILKHISEEGEIFQGYLSSIAEKFKGMDKVAIEVVPRFQEVMGLELDESKKAKFDEVYKKVLDQYLKAVLNVANTAGKSEEDLRLLWQHADSVISSLEVEEVFFFEDKNGKQFDFTKFYEEMQQLDAEKLKKRVNQRLEKLKVF